MDDNLIAFIDDFVARSEKFVASTEIWDDYPTKSDSYLAIAAFLKTVVIPSLLVLKRKETKK